MKALIQNPKTGQKRWFLLPLYFGKLSLIGHSCNYDDQVYVEEVDGTLLFAPGYYTLHELEELNRLAEAD